jgi:DeoR/GlpR family transcriptional regulator of sugar metabolism
MKAHLYLEERQREILKLIKQTGRVTVAALSQTFGTSPVTIRADLQALAQRNLIVRTHGGAVSAPRPPELSLILRLQQQAPQKNRIGSAAAALVADGDALFLDTSSTALAVAQHLRPRHDLTILTNSLAVAQALLEAPGITVVMPGGTLQRDTVSLVGTEGLALLHKFNIQKGFFGAHGLTPLEGLTDVSAAEADVKRHMAGLCRQVIAVLDASKWGRVGLASFARLEALHCVITSSQVPEALIQPVRAAGVTVIQV